MHNKDYDYNSNICKINRVQFSLLSPEEIKNQSTCKISDHTLYITSQDGISTPSPGGLYDLKMGTIDANVICETCEQKSSLCPGHFGYIELAAPVFHMHFISRILKLLKCICFRCSKLLLPNDEFIKGKDIYETFDLIYDKSKKIKVCNNINGCGANQPTRYIKEGIGKIFAEWIYKEQENKKVLMKPDYVLKTFKRITNDDCIKLGFSPDFCRPEWLILTVLPVPPPAVRPSVKQDNNQRSDDDLTYKLIDIVKANSKLQEKIAQGDDYIDDHITMIQYHCATLINNDTPFGTGVPQANVQRSGRTLKSLQQRVKSKEGRIRGNLMGKRVDFSARTVITPDPNVGIDELGVPIKIASNLTFPETVTKLNINTLKKMILNGYDIYPGVKSIKKLDKSIKNLKHVDLQKISEEVEEGDIVNRHLIDGDYILFNRQPSLHKMSMMAHKIIVMPADTFRLNVCVTSPYNADFDGDEMNMHVPQSYQTIAELKYLAAVPTQIISPQEGKPCIGLVQDALLGASRLTLENKGLKYYLPKDIKINDQFLFNKKIFMNLMMWNGSFNSMNNLIKPIIHNNEKYWTGKQVFSTILPEINLKNKDIDIELGQLNKGYLIKKNLATSSGSLIHIIFNDFNKDVAADYLNNCQGITNNFLLNTGFSAGVSDLIINKDIVENIKNIINQKKENVLNILDSIQKGLLEKKYHTSLNDEFETLVTNELNKATDEVGKLTRDNLNIINNRFVNMESAGSKGNIINICQMIACVGQCSVDGKRIPTHYKHRTLPHFSQFDNTAESRGFVENSFYSGLKPHEFYFHAMGGREGIIDTAVKTSETGYIQRRLIKALEDVKINYDLTLRNHNDEIIQFLYGEDGYESSKLEKQDISLFLEPSIINFRYKFNTIDIYKYYLLQNIWEKDLNINKERLYKLYTHLLDMRIYIIDNIINNIDNDIYQCLNIDRIILNNKIKFRNIQLSNIELTYLFNELDGLINKLKIKRKDINESYNPSFILHNLIRIKLHPYNIYVIHKLNKLAFDNIINDIKLKFDKGFAEPGEMIGTITAQSIGEPATQMTLNTFHFAGVAAKSNVTRGVPRLKELLSVSKNIKNPSLSIYLKDVKEDDIYKIKEIKNTITTTKIKNLISSTAIYFDPDITDDTTIIQDTENLEIIYQSRLWKNFIEHSDYKCSKECYISKPDSNPESICPYILIIEFSKKKLLDRSVDMDDIAHIINNEYNSKNSTINCLLSNDNGSHNRLLLRIRLLDGDPEEDDFNLLKVIEKNILNMKIKGIDNIEGSTIRKITNQVYDKDYNIHNKKKIILDSIGTNLLTVLSLDNIDTYHTISNDIHEVLDVLGIEAARNILIDEFMDVITASGSSLNPRHIHVLVDTMTFSGNIMSIDRFGINRTNYGPIAKASFEEMTDQLYKSAMFGEIDNCKGVSSNVLLGQESICGTGICDILFDEAKFYSDKNININYDFDEEDCNNIENNFMFDIDENLDDYIHDLPNINLVLE
jgi:DNA-directed RNA polymerase II subunit RPB1